MADEITLPTSKETSIVADTGRKETHKEIKAICSNYRTYRMKKVVDGVPLTTKEQMSSAFSSLSKMGMDNILWVLFLNDIAIESIEDALSMPGGCINAWMLGDDDVSAKYIKVNNLKLTEKAQKLKKEMLDYEPDEDGNDVFIKAYNMQLKLIESIEKSVSHKPNDDNNVGVAVQINMPVITPR